MELLLWITTGFIIIGFGVLFSMKKDMENKVAFIKENMADVGNSAKAKTVIWWIWSTIAWGIASIFLIFWWFHTYSG